MSESGLGRDKSGKRGLNKVKVEGRKKLDKRALKNLLKHAVPYWPQFLIALVLVLVLTGAELIRPYIMGTAIDDIALALDNPGNSGVYRNHIMLMGLAFLGLAVLQLIVSYFSALILRITSAKIVMNLRNKVFKHIQNLPFTYFDKTPVGSIVTRVCNDTNTISEMYTNVLVNFFRDIFMMVGVIIVMFSINVKLAFTVLTVLPLIAIAAIMFRMKARKIFTRMRAKLTAINIFLSEHIAGMKIVQAFNMQNVKKDEFDSINREYLKENNKQIITFGIFRPFMEVASAIATALILWIGGNGILESTFSYSCDSIFFP